MAVITRVQWKIDKATIDTKNALIDTKRAEIRILMQEISTLEISTKEWESTELAAQLAAP